MQSINTAPRYGLLQTLIGFCILVNLSGLFTTIIGPDGTLYATIAKTMLQRNNYIELFARGADWLDKPHLPFWVTAVSFKLFGFTTWAYKLPGILFLFMGAWYTYLFAKEFYNKQVALWAVLILLTAQHVIISNYDVRAEGYLTGFIIASVFYFYKASGIKSKWPLVWGSLFAALSIMTKGMFALIPIAGAIAGGLLIQKKWRELFSTRWLIAALLILIFILPEIYCLYYQFDLHPEKTVFGQQHVSGVKFFFWDSQFGRFFNTGPIKGSGDIFFFLHTTLWAFLPWSIILYIAMFGKIKILLKRNIQGDEWFSFAGGLLTFIVFSLSKFQLPHYLNIVFPFFALITANYLFSVTKNLKKYISNIQNTILAILSIVPLLLYILYCPVINWFFITALLLLIFLLIFVPAKLPGNIENRLIVKTVSVAIVVNLFLNVYFYPSLLTYQSGSEAAFFANKNYKGLPVVQVNNYWSPLEFYVKGMVYARDSSLIQMPPRPYLVYCTSTDLQLLKSKNLHYLPLQKFDDFRISRLNLKFINAATRQNLLSDFHLVLVP